MNTWWWEIDIHGCYSLMKIAFAPNCKCKNNWRIWRHKASTPHSHDVTDKLWWRHNAKSEKTVPINNGEIRNWQLILAELCFQDIYLLLWMMIFGSLVKRFANDFHLWLHQSWKLLANRLTSDPKIIIHCNSCIILCIMLTSKVVIFIDSMVVNTVTFNVCIQARCISKG